MDITEAIRQYCEQKAEKLPRYFDGVQMITFNISHPDHHHQAEFDVELVVDVVKHADFIAHGKDRDLYAAVDLAIAKASRQITEYKDKLRDNRH
ncbi:MAG: ribosome-associated translation inhibitor RaiA [Phycisphaeraceae bacterium]|nr:ribosome-associated translation inhibitor RaiA [Phycisphaeraceae bacterium]